MISKILGIMLDYSLYTSRKISVDNSKDEYLFIQIQRLLESHRGKISRQEISDILHYSDSYLNKIVNRSVGMSLLEYRKFFMIKEAARLLSCTDKTISEIIDDLGFSGHTYFNSLFKNNTVLRLPNIGKTASYDQNEDPFFVNWNRSTKYPILSFMKSIVLIIVFIY